MPKLTQAEIDEVLGREGLVRLATTGTDGFPLLVPVAFLYRDRRILLTARARVAWLANIRRDPRVCVCVDEGVYPLRKVTCVPATPRWCTNPDMMTNGGTSDLPLADDTTTVPEDDSRTGVEL